MYSTLRLDFIPLSARFWVARCCRAVSVRVCCAQLVRGGVYSFCGGAVDVCRGGVGLFGPLHSHSRHVGDVAFARCGVHRCWQRRCLCAVDVCGASVQSVTPSLVCGMRLCAGAVVCRRSFVVGRRRCSPFLCVPLRALPPCGQPWSRQWAAKSSPQSRAYCRESAALRPECGCPCLP